MENLKKQSRKKGAILPLAIIMVVVLILVGLALLRLGQNARIQAIKTTAGISARAGADAGITEAVSLMYDKWFIRSTWNDSVSIASATVNLDSTYGNANFFYTINGSEPKKGYQIVSTGNAGFAVKKVHAKMILKSFWFGIGVKEDIVINVGGTIGVIPEGETIIVRTNSTEDGAIDLKMGIEIPGDVVVGPGGDTDTVIEVKKDVIIYGDTYAADEPMDFPSVPAPEYPAGAWVVSPGNPNEATISAPEVTFTNLTVGSPETVDTVYVDGSANPDGEVKIYVEGKLLISQGAELVVTEGTYVTIYVGGELDAKQGSEITIENVNTDSPEEVNEEAVKQGIYRRRKLSSQGQRRFLLCSFTS